MKILKFDILLAMGSKHILMLRKNANELFFSPRWHFFGVLDRKSRKMTILRIFLFYAKSVKKSSGIYPIVWVGCVYTPPRCFRGDTAPIQPIKKFPSFHWKLRTGEGSLLGGILRSENV